MANNTLSSNNKMLSREPGKAFLNDKLDVDRFEMIDDKDLYFMEHMIVIELTRNSDMHTTFLKCGK